MSPGQTPEGGEGLATLVIIVVSGLGGGDGASTGGHITLCGVLRSHGVVGADRWCVLGVVGG